MKRYVSITLAILVLLSSMISFADDKIIYLNEIVYDDDSYLYVKAYKGDEGVLEYLRIAKNFSGEAVALGKAEQRELNKNIMGRNSLPAETLAIKNSAHLTESNYFFEGAALAQDLAVKDNWLYDRDIKLLDVAAYVRKLDDYYRDNDIADKKPLDPIVKRYQLSSATLYHSLNYIDVEGTAAFGYWVFPDNDYLLVKSGRAQLLEIDKDFMMGRLIKGSKNDYWLIGTRLISRHHSVPTVYHLASDGKMTCLNDLFYDVIDLKADADQVELNVEFIGMYRSDFVVDVTPNAAWFGADFKKSAARLYDVDANLKITKRPERVVERDMEQSGAEQCYLGRENSVYFLEGGQNRIYNLTANRFFDVETKYQIGDVIGSYKKIAAVASVYDKKNKRSYQLAEYLVDEGEEPYICVEDLRCCGYDLIWNPSLRVTDMVYKGRTFAKKSQQQKRSGDIYYSDVVVRIDGTPIESLNIGGFSLVKVADAKQMLSITAGDKPAVGTIMGDVLYTDIKTYFDGELINGINVDGYTAISARAFHGRGYRVTFDETTKRVDINRTEQQLAKMVEKPIAKNLKVGTVIGHMLATDIEVYIDGQRMQSYNYDGYMVVMVPSLAQPDNGISTSYDGVARKLMIETR